MKKTLIVGALALLTTLSFAAEKLGTQNFAPEAIEKIKSAKTMSPMDLSTANEFDAGIITGLVYSSAPSFITISDMFWASKCTNEYKGLTEWVKEYPNKKFRILINLQKQLSTDPKAKQAYKSIILSERIANCGSDDDIANFIELLK